MALVVAQQLRRLSSVSVKKQWKIRLPRKLKGGFLEKWGDYWVSVAQDYKEVMQDIVTDSRRRPLKAGLYMSLIGGFIYALKTNPDEMDFQDSLLKYLNESAMLSEKIRNEEVNAYFNYMVDCHTHELLRRLSLGVCSFIWVDNYSKACGLFKSQCEYLKPQYVTFHERIIDIGFFGRWWIIDKKMEEFDINPHEWTKNIVEEKGN